MTARPRISEFLKDLLRSDMEQAIYEANLGDFDTQIATKYLIGHMPQVDIAADLECDRLTISNRVTYIIPKVEKAAKLLHRTKS